MTIRRVLGACLRGLPVVLVFTALVSGGAYVVLRHLPPAYSATSVVWLGSREAAILASPSAWSALGRKSGTLEEGYTAAAVLQSVPVLRRVAMSLELYERPDDLKSRLSTFLTSLSDSLLPPAKADEVDGRRAAGEPIQVSSLEPENTGGNGGTRTLAQAGVPSFTADGSTQVSTEMEGRIRSAIAGLQAELEVSVDPRSEIATITFTGPDPQLAAQIVNAIPIAFAEERRARMHDGSTGAVRWLEARVEEARGQVQAIERQIEYVKAEFATELGDPDTAEGRLEQLIADVEAAKESLRTANTRLERGRTEVDSNSASTTLFDSEIMRQLLALRATAVGQRRNLLTHVDPDHTLVRDIDTKIAGFDEDILAEKRRLLGDFEADASAAEATLAKAKSRLEAIRPEVAGVVDQKAEETNALGTLQRDLEANQAQYQSLVARLQEARQVSQVDNESISLIQPALPPQTPSILGAPILVSAAGALSFMFGVTAIAGLALLDRRIHLPGQVRAAGLSTLVSAPTVPPGTASAKRASFLFQEAVRRLFALTLYDGARTETKRLILVTSSSKGEGKTTVARALATCATATDNSTVLVDCDLRQVKFTEGRKQPGGPGLVGLLEGRASLAEVLVVDQKGGPDLLPVTEPAQHSTELLASKQMRLLLAQLRERYDFIVLDTPAVSLTPDAELLAPYADAAVFVIRQRRSTIDRIRRSLDLLAAASSPMPVAFANMTDNRFFDETYGYEAHRASTPVPLPRRRHRGLFGRRWAEDGGSSAHHRSLTFTKTDFAKELHS